MKGGVGVPSTRTENDAEDVQLWINLQKSWEKVRSPLLLREKGEHMYSG